MSDLLQRTKSRLEHQRKDASFAARQASAAAFMAVFQEFLQSAGVTTEIQEELGFRFTIEIDSRWETNACDRILCCGTYKGAKIWFSSSGVDSEGAFDVRLYGTLSSGDYRSGAQTNPEMLGNQFALLLAEVDRVKSLPFWQRMPSWVDYTANVMGVVLMCVSFVYIAETENQKLRYASGFVGLGAMQIATQFRKNKGEHALIDESINLR